MKKYLLSFFLLGLFLIDLPAQCPPPGFPDAGDSCPQAPILCVTLDGYCNTINNNNVPQSFPGCGGGWTLNNDEWFAFYAGSTTITIEVIPSNCSSGFFEGLQGGIYFGCGGPVMDVQCECTDQPFTLTSTNFIVGEIYWMVLDGCDGNICDYTINVLQGSTAGAPPSDPGAISGPVYVCQGDSELYSLLPVDAATIYNWTMTPSLGSLNPNDNTAGIDWTTVGTTSVCVDVANACYANQTPSCITVEVLPLPTADLTGSGSICREGNIAPVDLTITFTGVGPWEVDYTLDGTPQPPIVTSDNPYTLTLSTPGVVQLTSVETSNGACPGVVTGSATINETVIDPALTASDPLCFGTTDGAISTTVTGGTAPYNYLWTPTGLGQNPSNLPAGQYSVTVTDDDGCTGENMITLVDPPLLDASGISSQDVDCNNPTGSITTTVNGGTAGYSFQWSPSATGANPTGLSDGTYFATVTDVNGCTDTLSATVMIDTISPLAVAASSDILDCISTSITISGNGSSTGPNVTYQWTGPGIQSGGTTLTPTVDQPGTYTLTVTNGDNGCTQIASVTVVEDITPPIAVAVAPPITCDNTSIIIDGTGTDTGPDFTFQWTGPGVQSGGTTLMPTVDQPGTYTLTVTNGSNGCETILNVNVPEDTAPPTAVGTAPPITCDNTEVTISGNGSATGPTVTYLWTGPGIVSGETTLNPIVDQPGSYTLTVSDSGNGCEGMVTVTVEDQTALPAAVANGNPITCTNSNITIDGNGSSTGPGFTYQWTTSDGNIVNGGTTLNPVVDQAGTYTLTVVNGQTGCENMVSVTIGEDLTPPAAEAGPTYELTCAITTVQLDGNGSDTGAGFTYQWTGPGIVSGPNTLTPTVNLPGTYTITVTNTSNGCETTDEVVVTQDIALPIANANPPAITCDNPVVTIDGAGSSTGPEFTYQWTGPGIVSDPNTLYPVVDQPGSYTLTVTNTDNGCEQTLTVTVPDFTFLPDAMAMADPLTCALQQISINGNGSSTGPQYTYQWTTADGNIVSGANILNPIVDEVGTYTLTVINSGNGCENSVDVMVGIDTIPPIAEAGPIMELNCGNPTIQLNGTGSDAGLGITYSWTGPGVLFGGNTLNPTVGEEGIYTLTVSNSQNGCEGTDEVEVTGDFIAPNVAIEPAELITCAIPEIQLDGTGSSTGPDFQYNWTTNGGNIVNGGNTATPTVSAGGLYTLTVTNSDNQCTSMLAVEVPEDTALPIANAGPDLEITCVIQELALFGFGSSQGPEFTYLWTTNDGNILSGETSLTPLVNEPGTYTLTVNNTSNGCVSTSSAIVGIDSNVPIADAGPNQTITCLSSVLTLNGTGSSSGIGYTYSWQTADGNIVSGANTLTPQIDQAGLYELTVINTTNGCVAYSFALVDEDIELPVAIIEPAGEVNCNTPEITLDATGSSTNGNYSYIWNTADGNIVSGQGTLTPVVDQGGNYVLTISNNTTGCINGTNVMVVEDILLPILTIAPPGLISCTEPEIILDATGSSVGAEFQYTWTTSDGVIVNGEDTPMATIASGGTYELTILNTNTNCTSTDEVVVPENADLPGVDVALPGGLNCTVEQLQLDGMISGPGNLTYSWSTTDGNFVSGTNTLQPIVDAPGSYILQVSNEDTGCENSSSVTIEQNIEIPVSDAGPDDLLNCTITSINLDATNSETGGPITYQWVTQDGNIVSGGNTNFPMVDAPGTYVLEVLNTENFCLSTDTVVVVEDVTLPTTQILPPIILGCVDTIAIIDATGSTNNPDVVFEWSTADGNILSGSDALLLEVDAPGTYSLMVLDTTNGCFTDAQATVSQNTVLPVVDAGGGAELDCIFTSVQLNGNAGGQTTNFVYTWTTTDGNMVSGADGLMPTVDQAGMYTLVVVDTTNQCSADASVTITQDANLPVAVIEPSNNLNCSFTTATLDGTSSTQGPNLIYSWSTTGGNFVGSPDDLMPLVDQAGTYTLTINDTINSCLTSETIVLTPDTLAPILGIAPWDTLNCYQPAIQLEATTSGVVDILVNWSTTDGNIVNNPDSLNPTVDLPGTYMLSVSNLDNGCSTEISLLVLDDFDPPTVDAGSTMTLDCITTVLELQGTGDASGSPIEYEWNTLDGNILNGSTSPNPSIDAGGTYELLVTNLDNGCDATSDVTILQDQEIPVVDPGTPGLLNCYFTSVLLDGTGSSQGTTFEYEWMTADGNILSGATTLEPEVDAVGTYTLTITNAENGCVSVDAVMVDEDFMLPTVDAGPDGELTCSQTSIDLEGSGSAGIDFSYSWTTANGNIISGEDSLEPVVDGVGTYVLEITNLVNGCSDTAQTVVTSGVAIPQAAADFDGLLNCTIESLFLDGTGSDVGTNFTYDWQTPDGNILSGGTTLNPEVNQAGTYTLSVMDINNDCVSTAEVTVPIDTLAPLAEAGADDLLTCTVQSLMLDGAGSSTGPAFSYSWTTSDGSILSGADGLSPVIDQPGTYSVLVVNQENGCEATDVVIVDQNIEIPIAQSSVNDILTCTQTSINISGIGSSIGADIAYEWSTLDGNIISDQSDLEPLVDQSGTYVLTVLDGENGCEAESVVEVEQDIVLPTVDAGSFGLLTCEIISLALQGTASGNNPTLQFLWSSTDGNIVSGAASLSPMVNEPGTYELLVTDLDNGCENIDEVEIGQDIVPPVILVLPPAVLTCVVDEVSLDATASSDGANFTPSWSTFNGSIISDNTELEVVVDAPGNYTLDIINTSNGCASSIDVEVLEDVETPIVDAGVGFVFPCFDEETQLEGVATASSGNLLVEWETLDGTIVSNATNLTPLVAGGGTYTLQVTNLDNGCTSSDWVEILEDYPADPDLEIQQPFCSDDLGSLEIIDAFGGNPPYVYSIDGGDTYQTGTFFVGLEEGWYQVLVQDAIGCESGIIESYIDVPNPLVLSIDPIIEILQGESYQLNLLLNVLEEDVQSVTWTPSTGLSCDDCLDPIASPLSTTSYEVEVVLVGDCRSVDEVLLVVDERPGIYAPNIFSPDGDGDNDYFYLFARPENVAEIKTFLVFSRWGETVFSYSNFQPNDPAFGWDGDFRGEPMNPAVFVWFAEVEMIDGRIEFFKGDVTLTR